jgi:hypothetical protein
MTEGADFKYANEAPYARVVIPYDWRMGAGPTSESLRKFIDPLREGIDRRLTNGGFRTGEWASHHLSYGAELKVQKSAGVPGHPELVKALNADELVAVIKHALADVIFPTRDEIWRLMRDATVEADSFIVVNDENGRVLKLNVYLSEPPSRRDPSPRRLP